MGRVAGIDYGTVRIGIAMTDPDQTLASPWENYSRRSEKKDAEFFAQLAREERVTRFVVGLPLYPSGDESEKSREARVFGTWLEKTTGVPVEFFDERYSSKFADELLEPLTAKKRKARRDMLAAYIILTSWLESQPKNRPSTAPNPDSPEIV
ncbi:MAG: Holliday junction resolvase RuvX [Planctomycetia bacterium]|nr:Holliday junction resolvase RuvX [Planctomycetia bacterium]